MLYSEILSDLKLVRRLLLFPLCPLINFVAPSYSANDAISEVSFSSSLFNPPTSTVEINSPFVKRATLSYLSIIGSGGGGTVFSGYLTTSQDSNTNVIYPSSDTVMKVSNPLSSDSVMNECSLLRYLSDKTIQSIYFKKRPLKIETCVASCQLKDIRVPPSTNPPTLGYQNIIHETLTRMMITNSHRQVIFLQPFFPNYKDNKDIIPISMAELAARDLIHTTLSMIALGVTNSDVQTLVDPSTGSFHITSLC